MPIGRDELHEPIYLKLIEVAKRQDLTVYSDIAPLAGLEQTKSPLSKKLLTGDLKLQKDLKPSADLRHSNDPE